MPYSSKSRHTPGSSTDSGPIFWYRAVVRYLLKLIRVWIRTLLRCGCTGTRLRTRSDVEPFTMFILQICIPP